MKQCIEVIKHIRRWNYWRKNNSNGRFYKNNYLDKQVTGFYPRFDLMRSNDSYNPMSRIQIVAWIEHDFERSDNHDGE